MGLADWLRRHDPEEATVLESEKEQVWYNKKTKTVYRGKKAPKGKSKHGTDCKEQSKGKWVKITTPGVLGDALDEALRATGYYEEEE